MKTGNVFFLTAMLAIAGSAQAQFSATISAVSDYEFRGVSLSARDPALQVSADYAFGDSGLSIGAWASNIDSGPDVDGDLELDYYADFTKMLTATLGLTTGVTYYSYPDGDDSAGYPEAYVGLLAGDFELKQWLAYRYIGGSDSALYTEANYTVVLPAKFSLAFHAGYSYGDAFDGTELMDYSITLGYTWDNFVLGLKATGTDARGALKEEGDVFNNQPRFLVSIATTLPWAKD